MPILILLSLLSFAGYLITNKRPFAHEWQTKLDHYIKIVPIFVIPYVLVFPYITATYLLLTAPLLEQFSFAIIICNISATIFWWVFPNGVKRELIQPTNFLTKIINIFYQHDGDTNGFPSAHVFVSIITSYYLTLQFSSLAWVFLLVGFLISISTVLIKQHYVVDILGGLLFATISILATHYFFW